MKKLYAYLPLFFCAALFANAQGTLIYDQESDAEPPTLGPNLNASPVYTIAQSFTPTLSSVGFINLAFNASENEAGGTAYVDLWSGAVGGTLLASSIPVSMPVGWAQGSAVGVTNFFFSTPIAVNPGTKYYFQPILNAADSTNQFSMYILASPYNYPSGEAFYNGAPLSGEDLWFQEGTYVVPEPPLLWQVLLGSGIWFYVRRTHKKHRLA